MKEMEERMNQQTQQEGSSERIESMLKWREIKTVNFYYYCYFLFIIDILPIRYLWYVWQRGPLQIDNQ